MGVVKQQKKEEKELEKNGTSYNSNCGHGSKAKVRDGQGVTAAKSSSQPPERGGLWGRITAPTPSFLTIGLKRSKVPKNKQESSYLCFKQTFLFFNGNY